MNILYLMDISPLEDKVLFDKYFEKMPPARREKVERLRFQKDKYCCTAVFHPSA